MKELLSTTDLNQEQVEALWSEATQRLAVAATAPKNACHEKGIKMILLLEFWDRLCSTRKFMINGVSACKDDFGEMYDRDSENAEDYGCGDMQFTRNPSTNEILDKYRISEDQYQEVCKKLEEGLSFGSCGWCI